MKHENGVCQPDDKQETMQSFTPGETKPAGKAKLYDVVDIFGEDESAKIKEVLENPVKVDLNQLSRMAGMLAEQARQVNELAKNLCALVE